MKRCQRKRRSTTSRSRRMGETKFLAVPGGLVVRIRRSHRRGPEGLRVVLVSVHLQWGTFLTVCVAFKELSSPDGARKGDTLHVYLRSRFSLQYGQGGLFLDPTVLGRYCHGHLFGVCWGWAPLIPDSDTPPVESWTTLGPVSFYWGFGSPSLGSQHREYMRSQRWGPYRLL